RWLNPLTTAVQTERRVQAWMDGKPYTKRYEFVPLSQISPDFQHAVIAAEDARFYQHTASIGTPWKLPRKMTCRAAVCGAGPPSRSSSSRISSLEPGVPFSAKAPSSR